MKEKITEGIVLRSQIYRERSRILSLFTLEAGLVDLIVKRVNSPRLLALTTPFTRGEYLYSEGRSTLYSFLEGKVLDEQLALREKLSSLRIAGAITQLLLKTLLPGAALPSLYLLYRAYLAQIPRFESSAPLLATFLLKMLNHEGALDLYAFAPADRNEVKTLLEMRSFDALRQTRLSRSLEAWMERELEENAIGDAKGGTRTPTSEPTTTSR